MNQDHLEALLRQIDTRQVSIWQADSYYRGSQPLAFLSPEARKQLGDRLTSLNANYPRLATDSLAERLQVTGFTRGGESLGEVWAAWTRSGMATRSREAILEALTVGQAFLLVWTDASGRPVVTVESPREMTITRDPLTGEITEAVKRWRGSDGFAHAVHYGPDQISVYRGPEVPVGGIVPNSGYALSESIPNPLGVVPVADLTNSEGFADTEGTPESRQIWGLTDALAKILSDSMVASEAAALPRRWATGVQLQFDAEGNLIPPFNTQPGNVWLSETAETKFGQFAEPSLQSYGSHVEMLIRQIGAISGLPDHLVGIAGTDPSSAEQIRASESSLVARSYQRQARFAAGFAKAAGLVEAILTNGVPADIETVWKSPESRTYAQEADAASKLVQAGILPLEVAWRQLGYSPSEIVEMRQARLREALDRQPVPLPVTEEPDDEG